MGIWFIIVYITWFASEVLINRLLRSKSNDKKNLDKNSLKLIWATVIVAVSVSVTIAEISRLTIYKSYKIQLIGPAIILLGCILRFLVIKSLGRQFTADVTIREGHLLKTDGAYKYLRHPSYSASLLSFIGFGFTLNNWVSLALLTAAILLAFSVRIKVEEAALMHQFGTDYRNYKMKTRKLIPFVY